MVVVGEMVLMLVEIVVVVVIVLKKRKSNTTDHRSHANLKINLGAMSDLCEAMVAENCLVVILYAVSSLPPLRKRELGCLSDKHD